MVATAANSTDTTPVTAAPRNAEQVRNTQKRERNKQRLSRDALYNLHEFAYDSGFIHKICTFPDLSVICYNQDVVAVFNSLLSTSAQSATPTIVITYDTTFNLGDFYLSILLFRETEFEPSPIIPLAYYIHERKLQATHDEFFGHIRCADNRQWGSHHWKRQRQLSQPACIPVLEPRSTGLQAVAQAAWCHNNGRDDVLRRQDQRTPPSGVSTGIQQQVLSKHDYIAFSW